MLRKGKGQVIAVSYHDRVNVLQGLNCSAPSPFDRPDYLELLETLDGKHPLIAVARDDSGCVVLPLMRENGALVPLANWYSFTWRPLASQGARALSLLTALARDLKTKAGHIAFRQLPDEDGSAGLLQQAMRKAGWITFRSACDTNHILPVAGRDYTAYLASRPGPLRTTLKRKGKKLETEILREFHADAWDIYEDIYRQSWKPQEGNPAMLRRFAEMEGAAARLRLAIARKDGVPLAAQFWSVEGGIAYIHKLAQTPEGNPLSAGTVLTAALFEQVIDCDRVDMIDFGTGNDSYKADWMDEVRPRFRLDCYRIGDVAGWPMLARAALRHLASRAQHG